jgi:uncharacterized protein (DUF779 family)
MTVLDVVLPATTTDATTLPERPVGGPDADRGVRRVVPTTAAYKALVALHARRGPVVLSEPGHLRAGHHRMDCVPAREFAITAADRLVGVVDRCAVHVDADADDRDHWPVYLLDVTDGPGSEATLVPDGAHHFVLRRLGVAA